MSTLWDLTQSPNQYDGLPMQFIAALRERAYMTGGRFPFKCATKQGQGTITGVSISGGNITFSFNQGTVPVIPGTTSYMAGGTDYGPSADRLASLGIVVDADDPRQVIRFGAVTAESLTNTGGVISGTITLALVPDWTGQLTHDPTVLIGRTFYAVDVQGPPDSLWWSERCFRWANHEPTITGTTSTGTAGLVTDITLSLTPSALVGKHLWTSNHRLVITANTATTISFSSGYTPTVADGFAVLEATDYYEPGRTNCHAAKWAFTPTDAVWSHDPHGTDPIAGTILTVDRSYTVNDSGGGSHTETEPVMDADNWIYPNRFTDGSTPKPDIALSPLLPASWRGVQWLLEQLAPKFVANVDYTGYTHILPLTVLDIYPTSYVTQAALPAEAETFWYVDYELQYGTRAYVRDGPHEVAMGTSLGTIGTMYSPTDSALAGVTTFERQFSAGWIRKLPAEILHLYDNTAFVPAQSGGTIYDPPTTSNPGSWQTRPKSTHLKYTDARGQVFDSTLAMDLLTTGQKIRYVGDCWNHPGISYTGGGSVPASVDIAYARWLDVFFEGTDDHHALGLTGTVTAAGTTWLTDTTQAAWSSLLRTESGTATSGSTTSLADSGQSGNAFWTGWAAQGRLLGFTVEIKTHSSPDVWESRLVNSVTGTGAGITLHWGEALSVSANGLPYRIREPKKVKLNRYKDRVITFADTAIPSGERVQILTGNSDHAFFFPALSVAPTPGTGYTITEYEPGEIYQYASTGATWTAQGKNTAPTELTRYGRICKGDYRPLSLWQNLVAALNAMTATLQEADFTNDPAGTGAENNQFTASGLSMAPQATWLLAYGQFMADFVSSESNIPYSDWPSYTISLRGTIPTYTGSASSLNRYMYPTATVPYLIGGVADFYCLTEHSAITNTGTSGPYAPTPPNFADWSFANTTRWVKAESTAVSGIHVIGGAIGNTGYNIVPYANTVPPYPYVDYSAAVIGVQAVVRWTGAQYV